MRRERARGIACAGLWLHDFQHGSCRCLKVPDSRHEIGSSESRMHRRKSCRIEKERLKEAGNSFLSGSVPHRSFHEYAINHGFVVDVQLIPSIGER